MASPSFPNPQEAAEYFKNKMQFSTGPAEVAGMIKNHKDEIVIVDVRAADDYAKGHVPGAINLPKDQWSTLEGLDEEKTNILYCYTQACHLAAEAAMKFAQRGFPVVEMDGGFKGWKEQNLDIETQIPTSPSADQNRVESLRH